MYIRKLQKLTIRLMLLAFSIYKQRCHWRWLLHPALAPTPDRASTPVHVQREITLRTLAKCIWNVYTWRQLEVGEVPLQFVTNRKYLLFEKTVNQPTTWWLLVTCIKSLQTLRLPRGGEGAGYLNTTRLFNTDVQTARLCYKDKLKQKTNEHLSTD